MGSLAACRAWDRPGRPCLLLLAWLLCLFQGVAHADPRLHGGWREARPGDTPAALEAEFRQGHLQRFDPSQLNRFPQAQGAWLVLQPEPPWVDEERVLAILPPTAADITVYDAAGAPHPLSLDPADDRPLGHGRLAYRIPSTVSASTPIVLKVQGGPGLSPVMRFQITPLGEFLARDARWLVLFSACFGVMLSMALMAQCFALMMRDSIFSWYAGYVFCYALIQAVQSGFLFHPLGLVWLIGSAGLVSLAATALSVAFAALFMARFCELQRFAPLLRPPVLGLAIGMPLLVLMRTSGLPLLVDMAQALVGPLLVLAALLMLVAAVVAAAHGSRHAWFFLAGWIPLLAFTALATVQANGALPQLTWLGDASVAVGAFEAIVLSIGLGDRALTIRRDRDLVRVLADNDSLTGLLNRRAWGEAASGLLERSSARPAALLFLDLDRFKILNDQQGHAAGDRALVAVANALRAELRPDDPLGRYGGEEFIALLDGVVREQALQIATRLCRRVHRLEIPVNQEHRLSISIGVAMRQAGDSLDTLVERADQAMYAAKVGGRNQARLYEPPAPPPRGRKPQVEVRECPDA